MIPIYWISRAGPGRLATLSRPRAPELLHREVGHIRDQGVDVLVSLLTDDEVHDLFLQEEAAACKHAGIEFVSFPIQDLKPPPSIPETAGFVRDLKRKIDSGGTVAIHCRGGIGRSSVIAACVLALEGVPSEVAFDRISIARGWEVPNTGEQREWVAAFEQWIASSKQ